MKHYFTHLDELLSYCDVCDLLKHSLSSGKKLYRFTKENRMLETEPIGCLTDDEYIIKKLLE